MSLEGSPCFSGPAVSLYHLKANMPQEILQFKFLPPSLKEVAGEGVAEDVWTYLLAYDTSPLCDSSYYLLYPAIR